MLAVDDKHMEQLTEDCRIWINQIEEFLKRSKTNNQCYIFTIDLFSLCIFCSHGFRLILDSEIGFALLHMSIQKFCNPKNTAG